MKSKLKFFTFTFFLLLTKKSFAATEFITNGDFQTGNLSGWTNGGAGFINISAGGTRVATPVFATGSDLSQTVTATFNGTYLASFFIKTQTDGNTAAANVQYGVNPTGNALTFPLSGGVTTLTTTFTQYSYSIRAKAGDSLLLKFISVGDCCSASFFIDNVSILGTQDAARINSNNNSSLNAYDAITNASNATGNLATIQDYLVSTSNGDAQREQVAKSVTPQSDNSLIKNAIAAVTNSADIIESRLGSIRDRQDLSIATNNFTPKLYAQNLTGAKNNSRTDFAKDQNIDQNSPSKNVWIQTFANRSKQGNMKNSDGYNSTLTGIAFGADHELDNVDGHLGASISIANSNSKSIDSAKNTNAQNYQFNIYGDYNFDQYFVNAVVGASKNRYHSRRDIALIDTQARANFSGETYLAKMSIGSKTNLANNFTLTPQLSITYAYNKVSEYTESDAGTLNLNVRTQDAKFFETRAGATLGYNFVAANKTVYIPTLSASFGHDFVGAKQNSTVSFEGQNVSFNSQGSSVYKNSIKVGAGLNVYCVNAISVNANYSFEHKTLFQSHSGNLAVKYSF